MASNTEFPKNSPAAREPLLNMITSESEKKTALYAMIFLQLITGSTYMIAKIGLAELSPFSLGFLRFTLTALLCLGLMSVFRSFDVPQRSDWPLFLWLATLCVPLNQGLFLHGIQLTFASHGALLYATSPMLVLLLSRVMLGEPLSRARIAGVGLGFTGVLVVLMQHGFNPGTGSFKGDAYVFAAVVVWALYTVYSKRALQKYPPLMITGYSFIIGAVLFLPIGLPSIWNETVAKVSWKGAMAVGYLAIGTSMIGYLVWSWSLARLDSVKVAIISNLQPVVAAFMGWLVLSEPVTLNFWCGAALVFAGVLLTQKG